MNLKTIIALLLVGVMVALLTGIPYALTNSAPIVNVIVGLTIFFGAFSLYTMYNSRLCNNPKTRNMMLYGGLLGVIFAYYILEILLRLGIK